MVLQGKISKTCGWVDLDVALFEHWRSGFGIGAQGNLTGKNLWVRKSCKGKPFGLTWHWWCFVKPCSGTQPVWVTSFMQSNKVCKQLECSCNSKLLIQYTFHEFFRDKIMFDVCIRMLCKFLLLDNMYMPKFTPISSRILSELSTTVLLSLCVVLLRFNAVFIQLIPLALHKVMLGIYVLSHLDLLFNHPSVTFQ